MLAIKLHQLNFLAKVNVFNSKLLHFILFLMAQIVLFLPIVWWVSKMMTRWWLRQVTCWAQWFLITPQQTSIHFTNTDFLTVPKQALMFAAIHSQQFFFLQNKLDLRSIFFKINFGQNMCFAATEAGCYLLQWKSWKIRNQFNKYCFKISEDCFV